MNKKFSLIIFTDLDGSLLHRDNFKFDVIKEYIKSLKDDGITIVPNTSKTEKEIKEFTKELGLELPFISENGSLIKGLDLINPNFPNNIILSRDKQKLFEIFTSKVPEELKKTFEIPLALENLPIPAKDKTQLIPKKEHIIDEIKFA